jgi:hypothetical protein
VKYDGRECEVCGMRDNREPIGCWDGRAHGHPDLKDVPMCGNCMMLTMRVDVSRHDLSYHVRKGRQARAMAGLLRALRGDR